MVTEERFGAPNYLALFCSKSYSSLVSDLSIMDKPSHLRERYLQKSSSDSAIFDYGEHVQKYHESWFVLCDKGYVGALEVWHFIHPQREPLNGSLYVTEEAGNDLVASNRVIIKNYFG